MFKTECKTSSVASAVGHAAPSFKCVINCNGLSLLIFEEKWSNYASGPKSAPNSDSFWVRQLFNLSVRVFSAPNTTILLVYFSAKVKMPFIWKDDFFAKIVKSNFPIFLSVVLIKKKTNYLSNQTWVKCYHSRNKH